MKLIEANFRVCENDEGESIVMVETTVVVQDMAEALGFVAVLDVGVLQGDVEVKSPDLETVTPEPEKPKPAAKPKKAAAKPKAAAKAADPPKEKPAPSTSAEVKEEPAKAVRETVATAKPAELAADADIPAELASATSFRQVMTWMVGNGLDAVEPIVAKCEELKPHVPAIGRLTGDLSERVERALSVLKLNAGAN